MSLETVSIRLTSEQIERGKRLARDEGTTLSQKIRWLVKQWIEAQDEAPSQDPPEESQRVGA